MEDLGATLKNLSELLADREKTLKEREKEGQRLKATQKSEHPNLGAPNDVLRLNIGGERIEVLRRTLIQIEDSMLAARFSGRWGESLEKDSDGDYFIDQPPRLFVPMIDYLRARASETQLSQKAKPPSFKSEDEKADFYRMVDYYGMTLGIYPVGMYRFPIADLEKGVLVGGAPDYRIHAEYWATFFLLPLDSSHSRGIRSFEVTLGQCSCVQVGWIKWPRSPELSKDFVSAHKRGVGYANGSIAINCVESSLLRNGTKISALPSGVEALKDGTVIRAENGGENWYIDGTMVASSTQKGDNILECKGVTDLGGLHVPCISMRGACSISAIELFF